MMVLALIFGAACGGERQPESGTADSAAAGSTGDTAAPAPPADTAAAALPDTTTPTPETAAGRSSKPASPAGKDTAARPSQSAQAEPAPKPAAKPAPTPAPTPAAAPPEAAQPPAQTGGAASPETAPLRDQYHQAPRDTVSQVVYDGWKQYNLNCARCHGEDVLGTTIAPHLIVSMKPNGPINSQESFVQVVCAGRPEKGMPSWCSLGLEMEKINAIYSYVKGRSAGEVGPGRPAVKQEG
jgi:hypothetical protein